ncbi:hypothetical protein C8R47DRAFT_515841 [Mycena vitilis]|nr:hypothetical protein C8R47DRAFT_515841 [Mycena vitilis]
MDSPTLSLILPLLDLKQIALTVNAWLSIDNSRDSSLNWLRLPSELKSALMDVFSSPKLEAIHLRGVVVDPPRDLFSLFSEASSLKEMSLSRIYATNRIEDRAPRRELRRWCPQLRTLHVSDMRTNKFCHYMLEPQIDDPGRLPHPKNGLDVNGKLPASGGAGSGSLEHLRLWVTRDQAVSPCNASRIYSDVSNHDPSLPSERIRGSSRLESTHRPLVF